MGLDNMHWAQNVSTVSVGKVFLFKWGFRWDQKRTLSLLLSNPNSRPNKGTRTRAFRQLQGNLNSSTKIKLFITTILWIFYDQFSLFATEITSGARNTCLWRRTADNTMHMSCKRIPTRQLSLLQDAKTKDVRTSLRFLPSHSQVLWRKTLIIYQHRRKLPNAISCCHSSWPGALSDLILPSKFCPCLYT